MKITKLFLKFFLSITLLHSPTLFAGGGSNACLGRDESHTRGGHMLYVQNATGSKITISGSTNFCGDGTDSQSFNRDVEPWNESYSNKPRGRSYFNGDNATVNSRDWANSYGIRLNHGGNTYTFTPNKNRDFADQQTKTKEITIKTEWKGDGWKIIVSEKDVDSGYKVPAPTTPPSTSYDYSYGSSSQPSPTAPSTPSTPPAPSW